MRVATGDLWAFSGLKVVPTNLGWTKAGHNVMGAGVAKQASEMFPSLSPWYGARCKEMAQEGQTKLCLWESQLIMFPVKPLDEAAPWLSWRQPASLDLVITSTVQLTEYADLLNVIQITLPLVGCGNGRLKEKDVVPILENLLDDRFTLVRF